MTRGVIYLVNGPRSYLGELRTSVLSLRRHEPELPVTVFTTHRLGDKLAVDRVEYGPELHPLQQKVSVLAESPYDETLFLDTDTTILGPIAEVFDVLSGSNFAVAHAPVADHSVRPPQIIDLHGSEQFNTGVLCFDRSPETSALLERWRSAVLDHDPRDMWPGHNCDQTYFNRLHRAGALDETGAELAVLPNVVYNVRGVMVDEMKRQDLWGSARVYHHRTPAMKARKLLYATTDFSTSGGVIRRGRLAGRQTLRRLTK